MKHFIIILILLSKISLFGQIKIGKYSQTDTSKFADLELYSNKKFVFKDRRGRGCSSFQDYIGNWKLSNDTLILSRKSYLLDLSDSVIPSLNSNKDSICIKFIFDDEKVIENAMLFVYHYSDKNLERYFTDSSGCIIIPHKKISNFKDCELFYEIGRDMLSSFASDFPRIHYFELYNNTATIMIYRNRINSSDSIVKKYLIKGDLLLEISSRRFYMDYRDSYWGDLKFKF